METFRSSCISVIKHKELIMNKRILRKKLALNKKTVADLSVKEMKNSRAGEAPTQAGMSCITDILCCITTDSPLEKHSGNVACVESRNAFCVSKNVFC